MSNSLSFVGLDVHKAKIATAVAEQGLSDQVRYVGNFPNKTTSPAFDFRHLLERHRLSRRCLKLSTAISHGTG